jgi:hypothetical protein
MPVNESTTRIKIAYDGKEAERGLKGLLSSSKALFGIVAGSIVFSKMAGFMRESASAAIESENAQRKLSSALGRVSQMLLEQAGALQKITTYDDEAIMGAQALLATYVKNEEAVKKLIPAVMDLATGLGMDLSSAAMVVAKTIGSDNNALARYGIEIKKGATQSEKLEIIIAALEKRFGGMAKAMAETDAGKLVVMANQLGEIKEDIGKELLPMMIEWNRLILSIASQVSGPIGKTLHDMMQVWKIINGTNKGIIQAEETILYAKSIGDVTKAESYLFDVRGKQIEKIKEIKRAYLDAITAYDDKEIIKQGKALTVAEQQLRMYTDALKDMTKVPTGGGGGLDDNLSEEELKKRADELKKKNDLEIKALDDQIAMYDRQDEIRKQYADKKQETDDKAMEENANWLNAWIEQEGEALDEDVRLWIEANIKKKDSWTETTDSIISKASTLSSSIQSLSDAQTNREIKNLDRKRLGQKRYDKEVEKIEQEADERNRSFARAQQTIILGETIMSMAKAIMKSHATLPFPFNWVEAGLVGAAGGVQIAAINAQHFQRGYLGEVDRGSRADNMQAMIGRNEAVIPAPQYAANEDLVKAIVNGTSNNRAMRGGSTIMNFYGLSSEQVIAVQRDAERRKYTGRLI